jgi:hypothetical protein
MRDDLLHAKASVDWAASNFPSFELRLNIWAKGNVDVIIKELPPDTPNDVVVAIEKEPIPLAFQVECGAYINAIRSSLDILASALAERHCQELTNDAYFPVAASADVFASGKGFKGSKFIKALPAQERDIIESLKPYKGGNKLLYALHQLDIVRKHVRLLSAIMQPARLSIFGVPGVMQHFTAVSLGWVRSFEDETVLGLFTKGIPKPQFEFTPQICLNETSYLPGRDIVAALREFAGTANAIIRLFDY